MNKELVCKGVLFIGWLALQAFLYNYFGVRIVYDSHRFIEFTTQLVQEKPITNPHVLRYLGYPFFLFPFFKLDLSFQWVIFAQAAISGLAGVMLYKAATTLTNNHWTATIATGLFLWNPDLQAYNCYILTDSLFISLTTICLGFTLIQKKRFLWFIYLGMIAWATLVRPNGFLVPITLAIYTLLEKKPFAYLDRWILVALTVVACGGLIWVIDRFLLPTFGLMHTYERGDIIFGYYDILLNKYHQPQIPPVSTSRLQELGWFIVKNPFYFLGVALLKGFFFLIHAKPYYTLVHNVLIVGFLLPLYYFAWIGWRQFDLTKSQKWLLLIPFLLQLAITMLTIEDWDGRWLYPVLPPIFLLAAIGFRSYLSKVINSSLRAK
ncbi:glycosyltransferase family 39 protein [Sabulibacter ruber]|uniref:glycosyltransferase family 39 protein n=1 Tax=Sabulibacter ruber TaxID=2811901 RepID=UPI001A97098E|nr:glycosyltransferase family 39 protein [Sabulibacter ruber]